LSTLKIWAGLAAKSDNGGRFAATNHQQEAELKLASVSGFISGRCLPSRREQRFLVATNRLQHFLIWMILWNRLQAAKVSENFSPFQVIDLDAIQRFVLLHQVTAYGGANHVESNRIVSSDL